MGFGWSFYGFFIAASVWMALYFAWAFAAARAGRSHDTPHQPPPRLRRSADQPPLKLRRSAEASAKAEALRAKAEGLSPQQQR